MMQTQRKPDSQLLRIGKMIKQGFNTDTYLATPASDVPIVELSAADLLTAPDKTLYRLGHSSVLLKLDGKFWLTDPVFSERASPLVWLGPKRFHAPPIALVDLPPLAGVILSHDHYDHLDRTSVLALAHKTVLFLTPTGVGQRLRDWGVATEQIREHAWWQETELDGIRFAFTPAQHFSGRGLFDRNRTLWGSWCILHADLRVFFSGDSGYFAGFKEIGERYGPFDLTLMETGAYNVLWPDVHMQPEQSLQAHLDVRGRTLLPIHNGTFKLSNHPWDEPFERILALAKQHSVKLSTPLFGEAVDIHDAQTGQAWWRFASLKAKPRPQHCRRHTPHHVK